MLHCSYADYGNGKASLLAQGGETASSSVEVAKVVGGCCNSGNLHGRSQPIKVMTPVPGEDFSTCKIRKSRSN